MADEKELIASSEFNPAEFVRGMDSMIASLEKFSAKEDEIRADLKNIDAALRLNREEYKRTAAEISNLDKTSKTYRDDLTRLRAEKKQLTTQQKELKASMTTQTEEFKRVNVSANTYRKSIENLNLVVKQASDRKGKTFFDVVDLKKQIADITTSASKIQTILKGKISTAEMDKFVASLDSANNEFTEFAKVITFVKSKLDTLDPNSEEFAELNRIVEQGELVLSEYNKTLDDTDKKSVSLRTRLAALRTALSDLETQGKENTQEFEDMAIEAGKLQDQMEDTQQRIKVLASDTKALDFGIQAIRGVASAFGVAEGAAALFGLKSEDVAKSLQRLNAIMLVLNGLQELQTILQKQSTVAVLGQKAAFDALAFSTKNFRNALLATGIGAAVVALGFLVTKFIQLSAATRDVGEEQKLLNDIQEEAIKNYTAEVTKLDLIKRKLNDVTVSQEERVKIAKEYNKTAEEGNKIDVEQIENIGLVNAAIDRQIQKIKERGQARAAENIITQRSEALQLAQEKARLKNLQLSIDATKQLEGVSETQFENIGGKLIEIKSGEAQKQAENKAAQTRFLADRINKDPDVIAAQKELDLALQVGVGFITTEGITTDDVKTAAAKKEIENVYIKTLRELIARLREVSKTEIESVDLIQQGFTDKLFAEIDIIDDLVAKKQLTQKQGNILVKILEKIIGKQSDKAVADFKKKVADAINKLTEELADEQSKANEDSLNLLQDQFDRRARLIEFNEAKELADAKKATDDRLEALGFQRLLIGEQAYQDAKAGIISTGEQNALNILEKFSQERQELAADTFHALQEQTRDIFANVQLVVSETATAEIQAATEQFTQGRIKYEAYQKELTAIAARETERRIATALREADALLKAVRAEITTEQDPERLNTLREQERELLNRISGLNREEATGAADATNKETEARNQRIQELAKYATAVNGIIQQVVGFWQQVNQAEQESLERSITLQERRVEAATKIAERGNSEYLRLEEDRLQELQTKQENAARRQIAVNAALQGSQALTAFISALASGIALTGPIGGIAIAAAVIAAIASGYAIVQSLQPETPAFKKGTKYVEGREHPDGVDTVPAKLTKGEAVLPVDVNRDYHPAVKAIFDRKIPAKDINNFVNNYRVNSRVLPVLSTQKMSEAAEVSVIYDGQLLQATKEQTRKLEENNELLHKVEHRLKTMGVEVNLDRNGLAVSLMKAVEQFKIDKKT